MKKQTFIIRISVLVGLLAIVVSIAGLCIPAVYGNRFPADPVWKANDMVTLFGAVPALSLGIYFARKGSSRGIFLWMGVTAYMIYTFCFRLFGVPLNILFVFYSIIITLSITALVLLISVVNRYHIPPVFKKDLPLWYLNILLVSIGLILFLTETGILFSSMLSVQNYSVSGNTEKYTGFALDFVLLIPATLAAGLLIILKRRAGYIMAMIAFVTCFFYGAVFSLRAALAVNFDPAIPDHTNLLSAFYVFTCLAGMTGSFFLLKNMGNKSYLFHHIEKGFNTDEDRGGRQFLRNPIL